MSAWTSRVQLVIIQFDMILPQMRINRKGDTTLLKDITIRALARDDGPWRRGNRYYQSGAVKRLEETSPDIHAWHAKVIGSDTYDVHVGLNDTETGIREYECNCPAADLYAGACKHVIAVLKAVQAELERRAIDEGDEEEEAARYPYAQMVGRTQKRQIGSTNFERFMSVFSTAPVPDTRQAPIELTPTLHVSSMYRSTPLRVDFHIGREKGYVLRNLRDFISKMQGTQEIVFGKQLVIDPRTAYFAPGLSEKLWQLLTEAYEEEALTPSYYTSQLYFSERNFFLRNAGMQEKFFHIFLEEGLMVPMAFDEHYADSIETEVREGVPELSIQLRKRGDKLRLRIEPEDFCTIGAGARFLYAHETIHIVPRDDLPAYGMLLDAFQGEQAVTVPSDALPLFFERVLPRLRKIVPVEIPSALQARFSAPPLLAQAYFDYYRDGIEVRLSYIYGDTAFNPLREEPPAKDGDGRQLIRDREAEERVLSIFRAYDFLEEEGLLIQSDEERAYEFLAEGLSSLEEVAEIYYGEAFREKPIREMPPLTFGVSVGEGNLLEVKLRTDELDFAEIAAILNSYRARKKYHRLPDGGFLSLRDQSLAGISDFLDTVRPKKGQTGDTLRVSPALAPYLDSVAKEEGGLRLEKDRAVKSLIRDLRDPSDADVEVPETLRRVLRDYQATGYAWLSILARNGLGGILADDMGLGKTLQVLTFLRAAQDAAAPPSIVVTPTSLLYNWQAEAARFTPELAVCIVHGTKAEREAAIADTTGADLLITTYQTLRRDIEMYEDVRFRYVFLDEAQQIKNAATQAAQAVKKLRGECGFALTGTPIENHLAELWSIFDFLLPGYLGTPAQFKARFEMPIVRGEDERAAKNLRRAIRPFILRRMKKDVLTELPDKVERELTNEMTAAQKKVYQAFMMQAKKEYRKILKEHGVGEQRIKILSLLTRMRQIACDPALFMDDYTGGSGKLDQLVELVTDAVEAGHRILVFSQFTTMLRRIARRLEALSIDCSYLDGQTKPETRMQLVRDFNAGGDPVFLISLKAGGTGLNLTGADMVIHYDPWWNPAVEEQATDRAYRLGQKNNVQVIKLVTKDTVEEKIFELQKRKKALIDQMIRPGESFIGRLSDEDLEGLFE